MESYPLTLEDGHLFVGLAEGRFLFDTGAPRSFGRVSPVKLEDQSFDIQPSYLGLTAEVLSTWLGRETDGLLGGDIINEFDTLIDVPQSRIGFSVVPLQCVGVELTLDEVMGVPILHATIGREPVRMFFDMGAQISYLQIESLAGFPAEGSVTDFFPSIGQFCTESFRVPIQIDGSRYELRCGRLPALLGMTLMLAGTQGIVGNEVVRERVAGYFPRRGRLVLS